MTTIDGMPRTREIERESERERHTVVDDTHKAMKRQLPTPKPPHCHCNVDNWGAKRQQSEQVKQIFVGFIPRHNNMFPNVFIYAQIYIHTNENTNKNRQHKNYTICNEM